MIFIVVLLLISSITAQVIPASGLDCYNCFKHENKKICSNEGVAYCCDTSNNTGNCACNKNSEISAMKFCPLDTDKCGSNSIFDIGSKQMNSYCGY